MNWVDQPVLVMDEPVLLLLMDAVLVWYGYLERAISLRRFDVVVLGM